MIDSTTDLRLMQYNLLDLYMHDTAAERERWTKVYDVINKHQPDVLAVQELAARRTDEFGDSHPDPELAGRRLVELADAVGMQCTVENPALGGSRATVGISPLGYHVGLLWRDGIEPIPRTWRHFGRSSGLWHSLATITFDFGGHPVTVLNYHWSPFSSVWRGTEAARLAMATYGKRHCIAMGDANQFGSDVVTLPDGSRRYYDQDRLDRSHTRVMSHLAPTGDPLTGEVGLEIDRTPARLVRQGAGMTDVAAALDAAWEPTGRALAGHLGARSAEAGPDPGHRRSGPRAALVPGRFQ